MRRVINAVRAATTRTHLLRRVSYALHGFLVGLHLALFILQWFPIEKLVTFPLTEDDDPSDTSLSVALTMSGTIFATVYGALLVWITQKLALRRLLTSRQTLTAMHDEYNSWIGIGSALYTLYGQCRLRSALPWVLCVTVYLINITVLHIVTPSMLSLPIGRKSIIDHVATRLAYPDVDGLLYDGQSTEDGAADLYHALFTDASSLLPYVVLFNPDEAPGLAHSTIYDLPIVGSESDSIAVVNSTIFTVTCGSLDSLKLEDYYPKDAREVWHYNVSHILPDGTKQKHIRVKNILPNNALSLTWPNISGHDTRPAWNRSFYAYGTFDIEDTEGELLPNFTLPRRVAAGAPVNMSIVGCNLEGQHSTIGVNTTTRLAATSGESYLATSAEWAPWKPLDPVPREDLNILDLWTTAMSKQYETHFSLGASRRYNLGFMDKYLISRLNLALPSYTEARVPRERVQLHRLQNALSELVAAYFWSMNQVNVDNQYGIERTSKTETYVPQTVRTLRLNRMSILIGFVVSLVLMLLNYFLVRPRRSRTKGAVDALDTLGLLQTIWFVRGQPDILSTVGRVERPEALRLREAGMFMVEPDLERSACTGGGAGDPIPLTLVSSESPLTDKWRERERELEREMAMIERDVDDVLSPYQWGPSNSSHS
ncbi:uncharacterized protein SCHCODRAFT_02626326 [Schizophyllum commune H4-8]|nr:uncharacterized protein SCHCODRAFT_02626326 [Schizophyllum commune H4-8]KAI5892503.1 hypothetical protein SCHCODRAFT_02626326 [Schizophyllum commune H4-8]